MSRAIVVGGSRGIGLAIAKKFLKNNISVTLISKNESNLKKAINFLEKDFDQSKFNVNYHVCDISNQDDIENCYQTLSAKYKTNIDILVNSAGITQNKLLLSISNSEMETILNTNLLGCIQFTKLVSRSMIRHKKGSIVNVGSIVGIKGNIGQSVYSASKAGLVGFTKSLAKELGSKGVRVNLVAPGFIDTEMIENGDKKRLEEVKKLIPVGRVGHVDEVANAVYFLACESAFITGHVLEVDGGLSLAM